MASSENLENQTSATSEKSVASLSGRMEYPGQTMGIVALVLSFFSQIPALILAVIAWVWSNRAGVNNLPAKVAVAVSAGLMIIGLLALIGWVVLISSTLTEFDFQGFDESDFSRLSS
mgnify:FL=1